MDSHSNVMLEINGTFFLYVRIPPSSLPLRHTQARVVVQGEYHADGHDEGRSSPLPKLGVFTSQ